jgi:hypothetical protein
MTQTLALHGATPRDYVQQLNLRHALSPHVYRSILNQFYRFTIKRAKDGRVSEKVVREWLKTRFRVWPFHLVAHRARLVDRYLDWAVQKGGLSENPLAKLRKEYGQRTTAPVVRALLSSDPVAALEALRPAPRFGSFLGPLMREHLALMRAMGYRYDVHEKQMLKLDRFLQNRSDLAGQPLPRINPRMDEGKRIARAGPSLPESWQGVIQGSFTNRSHQKRRCLGQMDCTRGKTTSSPTVHPQRIGYLPNIASGTQPSFSALAITTKDGLYHAGAGLLCWPPLGRDCAVEPWQC